MKTKSALSAGLKGKCPRCREGRMFTHGPFVLSKISSMDRTCSKCGLQFEVEPGFFFGAMYVSYAISVALFVTITLVLYNFFGDPDLWVYITTVAVASAVLYPLTFRYSRIIFLHIFGGIKYNPDLSTKHAA